MTLLSTTADQASPNRLLARLHATQFARGTPVVLAALVGLVFTTHGRVPRAPLILWVVMTLVVGLSRNIVSRIVRDRAVHASPEQLERFEMWVLATTALSSTAVGATFWLVALHTDTYVHFIVTLYSMVHALGILVYGTPDMRHHLIRIIGNVGQGALFWLGLGTNEPPRWDVLAAYVGVVWLGVLFGREHLRQFQESLRIRDENAALLAKLEEHNKVVEAALREARIANEGKSRFLAAASHDLRQPLHALTMFLGTLTFHVTTDESQRLLGRIKETARVLEEQFNALLDLSRFDVGAINADVKPFRIDMMIERLIDEMRPSAEAKGLTLSTTVTPALVASDPMMIGRVLRNLLDNAIKYTSAGAVSIQLHQRADGLFCVEVIDTGPGIPEAERSRIFEEYVQLANPARQRRLGVGLGLAIVKRIDQLLGLQLELHSVIGDGSRFSFCVAAASTNDEVAMGQVSTAVTTFRTSATVWVLDDDAIALESLTGQLSAWGASVRGFARPEDLLEEMRSSEVRPQWIFSDDMLGASLSGLETARLLAREFGFHKTCLVTGNTESARLQELRASGFGMIVKPAHFDDLIRILQG